MTHADARSIRFAGLPLNAWAFGLRNWAAMMLALYAAFWLQLESASSAAVCVGILALPTRGQAFQKAIFRFLATVLGVAVSIVISGLFNEVRDLFILAFAGWLALCVFVAGLLDGNRAYGAVLSGYTVAIVAVVNVDSPQDVFSSGVNRGAAITVGILALALVNDVFMAPDILPGLLGKIEDAHCKVRGFARDALCSGSADPNAVAGLLKTITALHPDITVLPAESISGRARSAAARTAVVAMVREICVARAVTMALAHAGAAGSDMRAELAAAISDEDGAVVRKLEFRLGRDFEASRATDMSLAATCAGLVLIDQDRTAKAALRHMRGGRGDTRGPGLALYRSRWAAARNGLRVFVSVVLSSILFSLTGWPLSSLSLLMIGALAGLSATNPNPSAFARGAVIAVPLAAALAGFTEFVILDGADEFALLTIAMAPVVIAASLLVAGGNPKLFGVGFLILVFFPALLAPSNPQDYNPASYLYTSLLFTTGAMVLTAFLSTLFPTTDAHHRRWIMQSAHIEARDALTGRVGRARPPTTNYRDADRIAQLIGLKDGTPASRDADLRGALLFADLASAARRAFGALEVDDPDGACTSETRRALMSFDPECLRGTAERLLTYEQPGGPKPPVERRRVAVELIWIAALIDIDPEGIALFRRAPA